MHRTNARSPLLGFQSVYSPTKTLRGPQNLNLPGGTTMQHVINKMNKQVSAQNRTMHINKKFKTPGFGNTVIVDVATNSESTQNQTLD
jgi:hypothetical protein